MANTLTISKKLEAKLKNTDLDIQQHIIALHKKCAAMEINNVRLNERIKEFQSKLKDHSQMKLDLEKLSKEEVTQLSDLIKKASK